MNLKLQTVQPEFLAKLLQDVEVFKTDVDKFVDDYTETLVFDTIYIDVVIRPVTTHSFDAQFACPVCDCSIVLSVR